jgi:uncharacterized protein YndB with AHSA1/START domain
MSVKKDRSGRRTIQVEIEVPGTPEEVWDAIATAQGVSSWFVPTEEREDGAVVSHFGPGMDAVATKTAWDPPRRFAGEGQGFGPNAPPLATEWIVEARSGGTCVVRVVHSLFASSDDWDNQLESFESGWPVFFRTLRLYLTHFRGQYGATMQLVAIAPGPAPKVWETLTGTLGLSGAAIGQPCSAPAGVPPLAGIIESDGEGKYPHLLILRLDQPTAGIAFLFVHSMGSQVVLEIRFYLYGKQAAGIVARDEPQWQHWMNTQFLTS